MAICVFHTGSLSGVVLPRVSDRFRPCWGRTVYEEPPSVGFPRRDALERSRLECQVLKLIVCADRRIRHMVYGFDPPAGGDIGGYVTGVRSVPDPSTMIT